MILIVNYLVEKRDKNRSDWVRYAEAVNSTKVTIGKLKEHKYEFRVVAENANDLFEQLETDKAVLVKLQLVCLFFIEK